MKSESHLSQIQLMLLTAMGAGGTVYLTLPRVLASLAGEAAWVAALVGWLAALLAIGAPALLAMRFPGQVPGEYLPILLGRWGGKAVLAVFSLFFLLVNVSAIRIFVDVFAAAVLTETPLAVLTTIFLGVLAYALYLGIEALARLTQLFFLVIYGLFLFVLFTSLYRIDGYLLLPVWQNGLGGIARGAWHVLAYASEAVFLLWLVPLVRQPQRAWKDAAAGILLSGIPVVGFVTVTIGVFSAASAETIAFPTLSLSRLIELGRFFQRVEVLSVIVWFVASFLKLGILHYVSLVSLQNLFGMTTYRPLIPVVLAITLAGALAVPDMFASFLLNAFYFSRLAPWVGFALPFLLWLLALARHL
ncbi:MAG: GerAB/ArcD/ProY family transporter, partial [Firmicutes bacterium]|nr:GerAB/ArcD/ProY family transporter [Bacillota bacterium]